MDNAKSESIRGILTSLDKDNILLPEFQRDFVWDIEQTVDLFDSLLRNIFIGSIIYGKPSFQLSVRRIDTRERKSKGKRRPKLEEPFDIPEKKLNGVDDFKLLLDGQQRLTSIYRTLKGIDEIWFIANDKRSTTNYSNLLEFFHEFSTKESAEYLSIKLSDVYNSIENNLFEDDLKNIFESTAYFRNIELGGSNEFKRFVSLFRAIADLFKSEKLLSYYLLDMKVEEFVLFFERSNSRGVQLNFIDILVAKLYPKFNLRKKIVEFEELHPNLTLNREVIVRTISYLVSNGSYINRSYILEKLTHEHFNKYWDLVIDLYVKCFKFLKNNHILLSQSWMPYENMLIPMMLFLNKIPKADFSNVNQSQKELLIKWYWSSIFTIRYSSSSNTVILDDSKNLLELADKSEFNDKFKYVLGNTPILTYIDLGDYYKKGSAVYKGILNLINYNAKGYKDFKNNNEINFNDNQLEDHHIYPNGYLNQNYSEIQQEDIDNVANRTLIPRIINREISMQAPSIYLGKFLKSHSDIESTLESHLITKKVLEPTYDGSFDEFLKDRKTKIFNLIKRNIF